MLMLPGVSDSEQSLAAAAGAGSEADATAFRHRPLKIDVEIQEYYYDFLATEFPVAVPIYAALYEGGVHPKKDYERELEERVRRGGGRAAGPSRRAPPPAPPAFQPRHTLAVCLRRVIARSLRSPV